MAGEQLVAVVNPDGSLVGGGGGTSNVAVTNFPATQAVSGTVTALPSGTQAVSGTVTALPSGTQNVAIPTNAANAPLYVASGMAAGTLLYTTLISDVPGVVAANNFLSIFNPAASGKTLTFYQFTCFPFATGSTTVTNSMNVFRTTAASAGTLVAAANINKFSTAQANSVAEVRTGNPTTTNGAIPLISIPPAITSAAAGVTSPADVVPPNGASFICAPGEGIVCRTAAGTVNQLWDLGFVWSES